MYMSSIKAVYTFWNDRPCNIKHSTKSEDNVEFFDEIATKRYRAEPHILNFIDSAQWKGKKVLDLGSGIGTDSIQFAKAGASVTCVDLTESGIALCKKNFALHHLSGVFYQGNIEELDTILPADQLHSFDLIWSFGVVHHTPNPKRVFELIPKFLNDSGIKTYSVRLKGHGTAPIDLKNYSWFDWYESLQRGYCALSNVCSKIIIIGFSTGGLLALLSASQKKSISSKVSAVVSINSALKLRDIKSKMIPGINLWNELLEKFNLEKGRMEFVDDNPENPQINYSRNYIKGVYELEKLMSLCDDNLHKILCPTLVIQSKNDPVVNPISGQLCYFESWREFVKQNHAEYALCGTGIRSDECCVVIPCHNPVTGDPICDPGCPKYWWWPGFKYIQPTCPI